MVKTLILPIIYTGKTQFVIKPVLKPPRVTLAWNLYIWEWTLGKDRLSNNAREGHHSQPAVGDFLKLHVLDVCGGLALEHTAVQAEVPGSAPGSLQHLHDGDAIDDLQQAEPKEHLGEASLHDGRVVGGGGCQALERLGDGQDAQAAVDRDVPEPGHHADAAVLELGFAEEVDGGEVREAEGVESHISDVSIALRRRLQERKGLRLGIKGCNRRSCRKVRRKLRDKNSVSENNL